MDCESSGLAVAAGGARAPASQLVSLLSAHAARSDTSPMRASGWFGSCTHPLVQEVQELPQEVQLQPWLTGWDQRDVRLTGALESLPVESTEGRDSGRDTHRNDDGRHDD